MKQTEYYKRLDRFNKEDYELLSKFEKEYADKKELNEFQIK